MKIRQVLTTLGLQMNHVIIWLYFSGNALCYFSYLELLSIFSFYAFFSFFSIDNEESLYRLHYAGYQGTAGNAMSHKTHVHNEKPFTTVDRDNDR